MSEVPAPVSDGIYEQLVWVYTNTNTNTNTSSGICEQLTWVYTLRMTPGYDATQHPAVGRRVQTI